MGNNLYISRLVALEPYVDGFWRTFECQRCGKCCRTYSGTEVKSPDINRLAKALRILPQAFRAEYMLGPNFIKQPCPFYDTDRHSCLVYDARPETCRVFPLKTIWCQDGLIHIAVQSHCEHAVAVLKGMETAILTLIPMEEFKRSTS